MILLVEDDANLSVLVGEYLELQGYQVDYASDGIQALNLIMLNYYQLIILDLNIPRLDGIEVCRQLRLKRIDVPCLMLTARTSLEEKIQGFESGADDYLVKPFAMSELVARIKALMFRYKKPTQIQNISDLNIDWVNKKVSRAKVVLSLNATDWKLLNLFASKPHIPISHNEISYTLWKDDPPSKDALKMAIYRFRKAINPPGHKSLIKMVRSLGYIFDHD